jgi:hypothetical protein
MVHDDNDELDSLVELQKPRPKAPERPKTLVQPTPAAASRREGPIVLKPIPEPAPVPATPPRPSPAAPPAPAPGTPEKVAWHAMLSGPLVAEATALRNLSDFTKTAPPNLLRTSYDATATLRVTENAALACTLYDLLEPQGKLPLGIPNWREWAGHAMERYATLMTPRLAVRYRKEVVEALAKTPEEAISAAVDEGLRLAKRPEADEDAVLRRNASEMAPDIPWRDATERLYVRIGIVAWGSTRLYNSLLKNGGLPADACDWRPWTVHAMNVWSEASLDRLQAAAGPALIEHAKTLMRRK